MSAVARGGLCRAVTHALIGHSEATKLARRDSARLARPM